MFRSLFRGLGKLALWGASLAFLTGVSLLLLGAWLATFPILRLSPRQRRIEATMEMASAAMKLVSTFAGASGPEPPPLPNQTDWTPPARPPGL